MTKEQMIIVLKTLQEALEDQLNAIADSEEEEEGAQ